MKLIDVLDLIREYDEVSVGEYNKATDMYDCVISGTASYLPYRLVYKYADRKIDKISACGSVIYIELK